MTGAFLEGDVARDMDMEVAFFCFHRSTGAVSRLLYRVQQGSDSKKLGAMTGREHVCMTGDGKWMSTSSCTENP